MRLICTISSDNKDEDIDIFSSFLTRLGIKNECEKITSESGNTEYRIWIEDEDAVEKAQKYCDEYKQNPKDPRFQVEHEPAVHEKELFQEEQEEQEGLKERAPPRKATRFLSPAPYGPLSVIVLFTVILVFVWAQIQRGVVIPPNIRGIIRAPLLAPIEKKLLYDYPKYFEIRDHLFKIYTPEEIKEKKPPSPEARRLIRQLRSMPTWMGIYDRLVEHFKNKRKPIAYDGPIFEKISRGDVWRIFTPVFLHFDLLHIFFNLLWFILLGNQIEYRIGWWRYFLLIFATGIISNTAQYLMSGPFFMGLSGIVVGMAAFIYARQQLAPWEGYLLHRFTVIFLAIFVVGLLILQTVLFFVNIFGKFEPNIGIANTAHIFGGIVGYTMGRIPYFSIRHVVE